MQLRQTPPDAIVRLSDYLLERFGLVADLAVPRMHRCWDAHQASTVFAVSINRHRSVTTVWPDASTYRFSTV